MDKTGQRLRLNLSSHARSTIEADMSSFGAKESMGGFVSRIFESFASESRASIEAASRSYGESLEREVQLSRYRKAYPLDKTLEFFESKKVDLTDDEAGVIRSLVSSYSSKLHDWLNSLEKGESSLVRIRDSVYAQLYPTDGERWEEEEHYGGSRSAYLKALMEDYASKTCYEREGIVFGDLLEELAVVIDEPIKDRHLVTLVRNGRKFDVKPYAVMPDAGWNYHYLVGVGRISGSKSSYKPMSFRISRIENIRIRTASYYASGKVTKAELRELKAALRKRGTQYLVGDEEASVIRLSRKGAKRFDQILHGRPQPVRRLDDESGSTLEFDCTEMQIRNYFFEFGADALIVKPAGLRVEFKEAYQTALDSYGAVE